MILPFDSDKPVNCPECGACGNDWLDYWIDTDGIWHFTCFSCGAIWLAKAKRKQ